MLVTTYEITCFSLSKSQPASLGNYTTAGNWEIALQARYRGLFIRACLRQHTDYLSALDLKKSLILTLPSLLSLPAEWSRPPAVSSSQAKSTYSIADGTFNILPSFKQQ